MEVVDVDAVTPNTSTAPMTRFLWVVVVVDAVDNVELSVLLVTCSDFV